MLEDNRQSVRKVLRTKAELCLDNGTVEARTLDIGIDGVGMMLPVPVTPGQQGRVIINFYFEGKAHCVDVAVKVTYCALSNGQFRAGFQFVRWEPAALGSLAAFLK